MKRLVIIDGNAIIHRAYHAIPPLSTKEGKMVNAVYGFTSMLFKVWKDLQPTHIAVTFDMAGPTFRHEKFIGYKATRVKADQDLYDQIPLAHDMVKSLGLQIFEKRGYEADDIIGTISKSVKKEVEVFIVTGDMDTLQLVSDNVKAYTLRKGISDIVVYDPAEVRNRFGFGPEKMVDYKALRGDTSDNIPGVPGIGEKNATDLILQFGTVDELYVEIKKNGEKIKGIKPGVLNKLIAGEESARMSYELAKIHCAVPGFDFNLTNCEIKPFDVEKVEKIFQKFEFVSLLKRMPGFAKGESTSAGSRNIRTGKSKHTAEDVLAFSELEQEAEVIKLLNIITEKKSFSCRAVLTGKEVLESNLLGFIFVVEHRSFFVDKKLMIPLLEVFKSTDIELVGHDIKDLFKAVWCNYNFFPDNTLFDVMVASYLLHPGTRAHDATSILLKTLGKSLPQSSAQTNLFGVDKKSLAQELVWLTNTKSILQADLEKIENIDLFKKVEMALICVLASMELNGVAVDLKMLDALSKDSAESIKKITATVYKMAGTEFNIASPIQLREVLFEKLGLEAEGIKKGKTGLSTSAEELEKLRGLHPIIDEISLYREIAKLQNTYIDVLPTLVNKKTGRIHTHYNQTIAATGRLSSVDPNLQNIPIRTELGRAVRKAFVAEAGKTLISADYSQIELRIVASLAQDKRMTEIFKNDEDIHTATAAAIHNVPLEKVTKEMRYSAKEVNFGVLYGMGAYGLSWRAGISQVQAKDFIRKYFEAFSGVKKYIDETLIFTKEKGYCETLFGRRRYIPELKAANFQVRAAGERMAINHPIQGTAADLMKMAMIEVYKQLKNIYEKTDIKPKMILQVHDELVLEVVKDVAEEVAGMVQKTMENVITLRVPIKVGTTINRSWGEMK